MMTNPRRHPGMFVLAALTVLGVQPSGLAIAKSETTEIKQRSSESAPIDATAGFVASGWVLRENAQIALVGAGNGQSGVFAGMQCDPFEPRSHRLIFGALRKAQTPELQALFRNVSARLVITTNTPSLFAQFEINPEDRGQSNLGGKSDYTAAYLTQSQLDALNNARDFIIRVGTHKYSFNGTGSKRAIGAMICRSTELHVASRLIEKRREETSPQKLNAWRLTFHSGSAAMIKGRAEASTNTTNPLVNPAASFKIGVSCMDRRLYAHLDADINPGAEDDEKLASTNAFISNFGHQAKLVEVYRAGQRVTTFLVDSNEMSGSGHALSSYDMASLMESDSLIVVGGSKVIEFSTANAAGSLESLFRICSNSPR